MGQITELQKQVYQIAKDHGFHEVDHEPHIIPEKLMLIVSELSEAMEADRRKDFVSQDKTDLFDLCYNDDGDFLENQFQNYVKDTFEDELADTVIRILDLAEMLGIDLEKHIQLKSDYNKTRSYKHGGKTY